MAGVYSSLGFAFPLIDTRVCFQRSESGAQAVLPEELEDELTAALELTLELVLELKLKLELESELELKVGLELGVRLELETEFDFEVLERLNVTDEAEDSALDDELFTVLLVAKLTDDDELGEGEAPVPALPPPHPAKPVSVNDSKTNRVVICMATHHCPKELFTFVVWLHASFWRNR